MGTQANLARYWRRQWMQKALLACLPITAVAAHATQAPGVAITAAIALPILILTGNALFLILPPASSKSDRRGATAMTQRLEACLEDRASGQVGCVLIELEDQPRIEREWGQTVLQYVHREMVERIGAMLRRADNIFQLDQGLIGIVVDDVRTPELNSVISLVERLQAGLTQPMALDGAEFQVRVAVGLCLETRAPVRSGLSMLNASRLALADARRVENAAIRVFSNLTPTDDFDPDVLQSEVLSALADGEILPWFQPQISTDTGQITGFEALARWKHPKHGMIPPSEFIPLLERAGKMEQLSEAILNHALRAMQSWDKFGFDVPTVSVNFATQELRNPSLVERIKWDVDRFDLEPKRLTVEILETVISESEDDVVTRNICELGSQGFNIDLDDFGTGHATLANIRRFKVDRIKIDRSFVTRADEDPEQQRMVAAIVGMAERLEIETLAEGVESIGEQSILSQLGCTHLQGFGIARPMPLEDTLPWLSDHKNKLRHPPLLNRRAG